LEGVRDKKKRLVTLNGNEIEGCILGVVFYVGLGFFFQEKLDQGRVSLADRCHSSDSTGESIYLAAM